jgi:two-component system cell cycle sensor histidine kinase/response regulator CckA
LMDHTLPKSIEIVAKLAADCPRVMSDPTEVSQILMNLCINARDAMPDGGTLTIETQSVDIDERTRHLIPDATPGRYALLQVSDTGCGMTPEILDRIFDPFFTTKEVGKGTGLGLATVQGIVRSHGGFINAYSEPGRGTTFLVYLPAVGVDEQPVPVTADVGGEAPPGETILLVDDESFILQVTSAALEANGYRVITAADGAAAVEEFSKNRNEISAVLLDMMMPGMDGLATLDALRQIDQNVKVIACSGLRTSQREAEVKDRGAKTFLPKPYSEEQLLHALSKVLN